MEVTEEFGWYNRNAAINPFQVEGKRTVGHELAEQTRGDVPDWLVFSMGDGCTIYGGWKGFREFRDLGFVDEAPKMLGVQAEGARAIHDAYHEHDSTDDVANTLADSIAVGRPRNTLKAVKALNESGGTSVVVSDDEILRGRRRSAAPRESTPNPPGRPPSRDSKGAIGGDHRRRRIGTRRRYRLRTERREERRGGVRKRHGDRAGAGRGKAAIQPVRLLS